MPLINTSVCMSVSICSTKLYNLAVVSFYLPASIVTDGCIWVFIYKRLQHVAFEYTN